ncbi:MAG TPA: DoxX family protein [Dehalococcoidia bacterium]|nr:DoxX family protein [Dehalococcoidia bacterium]
MAERRTAAQAMVPEPVARLFTSPAFAWLWLVARVYLGYQWLEAGLHKVSDPAWMSGGTALKSFWERAVQVPAPPARPPITYDWYRDFLQFMLEREWYTWFAKLVAVGELAVGIALLLGAFTAIAAGAGAFMNLNFMLAGSASTNPVLFTLSVLVILAWRVAGYWGLDRALLRALGTPWEPGALVRRSWERWAGGIRPRPGQA